MSSSCFFFLAIRSSGLEGSGVGNCGGGPVMVGCGMGFAAFGTVVWRHWYRVHHERRAAAPPRLPNVARRNLNDVSMGSRYSSSDGKSSRRCRGWMEDTYATCRVQQRMACRLQFGTRRQGGKAPSFAESSRQIRGSMTFWTIHNAERPARSATYLRYLYTVRYLAMSSRLAHQPAHVGLHCRTCCSISFHPRQWCV